MTDPDAYDLSYYGISYIVFFLVFIGAIHRSVWLISWKYLVALFGALVCNAILFLSLSSGADDIEVYLGVILVHLGLAYALYDKFVMREVFLKPIIPALLIEKIRRERLPFGWIFLYIPHLLFAVTIVWIFVKFVIPVLA